MRHLLFTEPMMTHTVPATCDWTMTQLEMLTFLLKQSSDVRLEEGEI